MEAGGSRNEEEEKGSAEEEDKICSGKGEEEMTDRLKGFVVILESDLRSDDAEDTINAIKQIKGVLSVDPIPHKIDDYLIYQRVKRELIDKLWEVLK